LKTIALVGNDLREVFKVVDISAFSSAMVFCEEVEIKRWQVLVRIGCKTLIHTACILLVATSKCVEKTIHKGNVKMIVLKFFIQDGHARSYFFPCSKFTLVAIAVDVLIIT